MGVTIENEVWEPNKAVFIFLFGSCLASIFSLPHFSQSRNPSPFDRSVSSSFIRFQRNFLLLSSLFSVMEGLSSVIGEYESAFYGIEKEQIVLSLSVGFATALLLGTFSGILSDILGHKNVCLVFCLLHLLVGLSKRFSSHSSLWFASICLSLANSIYSFSVETWMVVDHDKLGHRQDTLSDLFWLMTFTESASYIGSQVMGNWLLGDSEKISLFPRYAIVALLAAISIIFITQGWKEVAKTTSFQSYTKSFSSFILNDKRLWLLLCAQASLQFSVSVVWLLWAPTIAADGREVNLGLIYPCFLGARMLGSTAFPWFSIGSSLRTEDCLTYAFIIMGLILSIVAYDYEEVGLLVTFFCLFHASVGLVLPSLAKLRTLYVPSELRGGMISLSLAPANAATLIFIVQRGIYQNIENSMILAFAAVGLFSAAGCVHFLKRFGKQPHQSWHKS